MARVPLLLATAAALMLPAQALAKAQQAFDLVIEDGTLIDGTGRPGYQGDLGISGGRIVAIGELGSAKARDRIDARGLYVTPGFISIHDHSEPDALPTAANILLQGVTTVISNPDGHGSIDIREQLNGYASRPMAVNLGAAIGFNATWKSVVGNVDRRPSDTEVQRMGDIIVSNLKAGAWAVSAGLDYKPGYYATTDEVVRTLRPAAKWRTIFPSHDRLMPEKNWSSVAAAAETIEIGEASGLTPVVTHMKAQGWDQGQAPRMLANIDAVTRRGHYAAADVYPYLAGHSGLDALFVPAWALDGGFEALLTRLRDPDLRKKIVAEVETAMNARVNGPSGVWVIDIGKELTDVMKERGVGAGEATAQLLQERHRDAILRFGREDDLIAFLKYPHTVISCDCGATLETRIHPRHHGSFPRALGRYVREQKLMSWEEAIRKMTGLPATMVGMINRGYLMPGMVADITVFDPATIIDRSTYEKPTAPPEGIRHVLVNGAIEVRDGKTTGLAAGKPIYRASFMPSRAESNGARSVRGEAVAAALPNDGSKSVLRIRFDLSQPADARNAGGTLKVTDAKGKALIDGASLGLLQTADGWFGVTGIARAGRLAGKPFTLVGDANDPEHPGQNRIHLIVEGERDYEGLLTALVPHSASAASAVPAFSTDRGSEQTVRKRQGLSETVR